MIQKSTYTYLLSGSKEFNHIVFSNTGNEIWKIPEVGLYKIGQTDNIVRRVEKIRGLYYGDAGLIIPYGVNRKDINLVCYGVNSSEDQLLDRYEHKRVEGEWVELSRDEVFDVIDLIRNGKSGYEPLVEPIGEEKESYIDDEYTTEVVAKEKSFDEIVEEVENYQGMREFFELVDVLG